MFPMHPSHMFSILPTYGRFKFLVGLDMKTAQSPTCQTSRTTWVCIWFFWIGLVVNTAPWFWLVRGRCLSLMSQWATRSAKRETKAWKPIFLYTVIRYLRTSALRWAFYLLECSYVVKRRKNPALHSHQRKLFSYKKERWKRQEKDRITYTNRFVSSHDGLVETFLSFSFPFILETSSRPLPQRPWNHKPER